MNDGWLDLQDPDCFVDGDETSTAIFLSGCTDGVDNDGDGSIDKFDLDCASAFDNTEDSFHRLM